ncbi:hypothetical protein F66182_5429 [Fusarium sp. NRRL 66182]|nr:hypothetical protein F66182_5429 [Fusarium sp. NRRL 66182]
MSLSAKVKDIFTSGDSKDESRGEATPHPPGSFPTKDMEPSETRQGYSKGHEHEHEHEHSKLHKSQDPRGWAGDEKTSRGHGYKDSGVGLPESHDPAFFSGHSRETRSERRNEPLERVTETTAAGAAAGAATGTGAGRVGDNTNLTSQEGTSGDNPYWGNLPSSAVGPDSAQTEAERHRAVHSGATQPTTGSVPLESGKFPTVQKRDRDASSKDTNPHDAQLQAQQNPQESKSDSHFNEGLAGAGVAGAGAAGAAAVGAHQLNKRHDADDAPSRVDQTTSETQPQEHKGRAFPLLNRDHKDTHHDKDVREDKHHTKEVKQEKHEEPKKDHDSKFGLFGRRSSKDETEPKVKEQPVKQGKEEHDSKFGGLFHRRGSKDHGQEEPVKQPKKENESKFGSLFARHSSKDETNPAAEDEAAKNKHHGPKTGPALAAAGLGGAATYAATRDRNDDKTHHDTTTRSQDPTATRGAGQYSGSGLDPTRDQASHPVTSPAMQSHQQQDSHRGTGLATGAAAGLGAGALASRSGQTSGTDRTSQPSDADRTGQLSGLGSNRDYPSQSSHPIAGSTTQAQRQEDSHRGAGLASGAAAGLGAGALASRSGQHSSPDRTEHLVGTDQVGQSSGLGAGRDYNSQDSHLITGPATQSHQQDGSNRGVGLAAGAAAGLGAGALASHYGQRHDTDRAEHPSGLDSNKVYDSQRAHPTGGSTRDPISQSSQSQGIHQDRSLGTGAAAGLGAGSLASHAGHQSGADRTGHTSGLDTGRGYDAQSSLPTSRSTQDPTTQSYQQGDSHRGAGLATGAAAGLGAASLASRSGHQHSGQHQQYSGLDSSRDYESQRNQPANYSLKDPTAHSLQQEGTFHTGLSAGALASEPGLGHQSGTGHYSGLDSTRTHESYGSHPTDRSDREGIPQKEDSHRGAGLAAGAAAGLGAGALASHYSRQSNTSSQYSEPDSSKGFQPQNIHSADRSTREPATQSHQPEDSQRGANLASGTAAGLGAGALASHEASKRHGNDAYTTKDSSRGLPSGTGATQGITTGATHGSAQNESLTESHAQSSGSNGGSHHHAYTDNANEGKYNTLASGTPSGVRE